MRGVLLALALVAYNNFRPELGGLAYVAANLSVVAVLVAIALGPLGLTLEDIGFTGNRFRGVVLTSAAALILVAPLFLAAAFDSTARFVADERAAGLGTSNIVWQALVRIPLGTALAEEVAFRGVLFASLGDRRTWVAALVAGVAFGLWHIAPTIDLVEINFPGASARQTGVFVVGAVVAATAAGLGFVWLRLRTGGIAAPFAFHAIVNSMALVAAVVAHRRLG
ncbi:MAG: lysostaphin resistance A-like protein [Actinomycetota bacterium]